MTITLIDVHRWRPCPDYTPAKLEELAAGRESITVPEALDLPIPAADRIWLLTRPGVLPRGTLLLQWVQVVVSRAVRTHALTCDIKEVEDWAVRWLAGDPSARTREAARAAVARAEAARKTAWAARAEAAVMTAWAARAAAAAAKAAALTWAAAAYSEAAARAMWWAAEAVVDEADEAEEREQQLADLRAILASIVLTLA